MKASSFSSNIAMSRSTSPASTPAAAAQDLFNEVGFQGNKGDSGCLADFGHDDSLSFLTQCFPHGRPHFRPFPPEIIKATPRSDTAPAAILATVTASSSSQAESASATTGDT